MDPGSAKLVLDIQLEEIKQLKNDQDKSDDHLKDFITALLLFEAEIKRYLGPGDNHQVAQSFAEITQPNQQEILRILQEEERALLDHEVAANIARGYGTVINLTDHEMLKRTIRDHMDIVVNSLDLQVKAEPKKPLEPMHEDIQDEKETTETTDQSKINAIKDTECVACGEYYPSKDVVNLMCKPENHIYCRRCIVELVETSLRDTTLFPPRCCRKIVSIDDVRDFLTLEMIDRFDTRTVELAMTDPTFCAGPNACSKLILPQEIDNAIATCQLCGFQTCANCKAGMHQGKCPENTEITKVLKIAEREGWQRCPKCKQLVELTTGCNHITCRCSAEFCYVCGKKWKTCACKQSDMRRLLIG